MWTVSGFEVCLYRTPNAVPGARLFWPEHFSERGRRAQTAPVRPKLWFLAILVRQSYC